MSWPTARAAPADQAPDYCRCEVLVLGCGNELFGDDGFGCAVAGQLCRSPELPEHVLAMDVGTSARTVLFDVALSEAKPRKVVVVDAVDMGREPGEVWEIEAGDLPLVKCDDFSMHQLPTSNLLRELRDLSGIEVSCIVGQVAGLPPEVAPGLSRPMQRAVDRAVRMILRGGRERAHGRRRAGSQRQ